MSDKALEVIALYKEISHLRAEIDKLTKANLSTLCAFCGEFFAADEDPAGRKTDALTAHMMQCEKHPMASMRARAEAAEREVERLKALLKQERSRDDYYPC